MILAFWVFSTLAHYVMSPHPLGIQDTTEAAGAAHMRYTNGPGVLRRTDTSKDVPKGCVP